MSRNTKLPDFCSEESDQTPLEQYDPKGYVSGSGPEAKAGDAAVALTASLWGPPFGTHHTDADGDWWNEAYDCACKSVQEAIIDAVVTND